MSSRQMRMFAFRMFSPSQNWSGLWTHPQDKGLGYNRLPLWLEVAQTAERGMFDGIFFADSLGFHNVYGGNADAVIQAGGMAPINDPFVLVAAMAAVTKHVGFGVTGNLSNDHPYTFARRLSTLDHLTEGRFGWNIVTGVPNSSNKAMGAAPRAHDARYDYADEFMDIVYKLWEQSWEEGAVVRDATQRVYAHPELVHQIHHSGEEFDVTAVHMCEPSPQRTPVLFQAGGSSRGQVFAAQHAECIFLTGPVGQLAARVRSIREQAVAIGRDPAKLLMIAGLTVIVAPTDEEAQAIHEEYRSYINMIGRLGIEAGHVGVDYSKYSLDDSIGEIQSNAIQSKAAILNAFNKEGGWKIRDLVDFGPQPFGSPFLVGSPTTVADAMCAAMDEADLDGFNLFRTVEPAGLEAFVDLVVPELQRRGRYKTEYADGTLRQKLYGDGDKLALPHPAAAYRGAPVAKSATPTEMPA